MASARIYFQIDVTLPGGQIRTIGNKSVPVVVTLDSTAPDVHEARHYIATGAEQAVLTLGTGEDLAAFKLAAFRPSATMMLGWRGTADADNSAIELRANTWFVLVNDATPNYNAVTATRIDNAATLTDVSVVYAGNESGSTAYIDVWAVN
jgi:hypothetical protein